MKEIYDGVEIVYNENLEQFECETGGKFVRRGKLSDLKKYIDNPPEKKESKAKFERIPVLDRGYGSRAKDFQKREITSFVEHSSECWISWGKGERSKVNLSRLILDCPENHKIITAVDSLEQSIKSIESKISELSLGYLRPSPHGEKK